MNAHHLKSLYKIRSVEMLVGFQAAMFVTGAEFPLSDIQIYVPLEGLALMKDLVETYGWSLETDDIAEEKNFGNITCTCVLVLIKMPRMNKQVGNMP